MTAFTQNCSLCEECDGLSKLQIRIFPESVLLKLYEFILISSVMIALYLLDILIVNEFKLEKLKLSEIKLKSRRLMQVISLSVIILTIPFITMLITVALLYKVVCSVAIKRKDRRFVKFLDSFDVFHCLENKTTRDIQGVIQSNTIELAVDNIKMKLHSVFANYGTDKIFYRRNEEYGFYYWRRYSFIDLAQYVQIEEVPDTLDQNLELNLTTVGSSGRIAPYNDEGLFKVIIQKKNHGDINGKDEYKLIMKFHHSIKETALTEFVTRLVEKADDCQIHLVSTPDAQDYDSPDALINMITKLCGILATSLNDNVNEQKQHDASFNRLKTLEWTKSDENLLSKVNVVRDNVCDMNIGGILGDSLARVMHDNQLLLDCPYVLKIQEDKDIVAIEEWELNGINGNDNSRVPLKFGVIVAPEK